MLLQGTIFGYNLIYEHNVLIFRKIGFKQSWIMFSLSSFIILMTKEVGDDESGWKIYRKVIVNWKKNW